MKSNRKKSTAIFISVLLILILSAGCNHSDNSSQTSNTTVEKIYCWSCGADLSKTYNYIETSPGKYECTLCYDKTMRDIHDEMKAEGYNVK